MADNEYKKIKREHVRRALKHILEKGGADGRGVWHVDSNERARVRSEVVEHKGKNLSIKEVMRVAFLFYRNSEAKLRGDLDLIKAVRVVAERDNLSLQLTTNIGKNILKNLGVFEDEDFATIALGGMPPLSVPDKEAYGLVKQFKQIVFHGPPGTGKTYRATKLLPALLGITAEEIAEERGERWGIVQFHPSYNYEDFVRGVKVRTNASNNVEYITENRVFGDMCKRAEGDPESGYVLIIDEINRANVSAVLGELIYALEYRGKEIQTPYAVNNDTMLIVPNNLYIIGTMNAADRTIGQIDYAVRRRFAFVPCKPDAGVIRDAAAKELFGKVQDVFNNISPDYKDSVDDVRIGHSYFLPKEGEKLADKIKYQVIPILREYVKDGVLSQDAKDAIEAVEKNAAGLSGDGVGVLNNGMEEGGQTTSPTRKGRWYWEKAGKERGPMPLGRVVLTIAQDYVGAHPGITIEQFRDWYPDKRKGKNEGVHPLDGLDEGQKERLFVDAPLDINGKRYCISSAQWGQGMHGHPWENFVEEVAKSGYTIRKAGESDGE